MLASPRSCTHPGSLSIASVLAAVFVALFEDPPLSGLCLACALGVCAGIGEFAAACME